MYLAIMKTMVYEKHAVCLTILYLYLVADTARGNIPPVMESHGGVLVKSESTKLGSVLTTLKASDTDGGQDLVFSVGNQGTGSLVRLGSVIKKSDHEWTVDVILKEQLDRDHHASVRDLLFQVTDGTYKIPVKYTLVITDENDESPLFLNLPDTITVNETTPAATAIYDVHTSDPDTGSGGQIYYTIQLVNGDKNNPFRIDVKSGEVSLATQLDFEQRTSYIINVTAKDGGGLTNTSTLTVMVADFQDTPPVFGRPSYTVNIPETISVNTSIVTVETKDGDTSHPNNIFLQLEPGPCDDMFDLDADTGEITVKSKLDREGDVLEKNNGVCMLNISAIEDSGNRLQYGPFTSWIMVMVFVDDVNDNHPIFNAGTVTATTGKHVTMGAPVVFKHPEMVTVYDNDRGPNGTMDIYLSTIGGHHDTTFQVSPQRAYSQAQIYLTVHNTTALRDYPFNKLTIELYAKETSSSHHVSMVTVSIDVVNTQTQCGHIPVVG